MRKRKKKLWTNFFIIFSNSENYLMSLTIFFTSVLYVCKMKKHKKATMYFRFYGTIKYIREIVYQKKMKVK